MCGEEQRSMAIVSAFGVHLFLSGDEANGKEEDQVEVIDQAVRQSRQFQSSYAHQVFDASCTKFKATRTA